MKKTQFCLVTLLSGIAFIAQASDTSRFSGELSINAGFATSDSNLNPNGDKTLTSLNDQVSHTNNVFVAPLGIISYALNNQNSHRIYMGTSRDDLAVGTLAFELGYQYDFLNGTRLDIGVLPTVLSGEVWADPYLVGESRSTTDIEGNAYRLKLSNIGNSGVSLDMAYATAEIDNDQITEQALLRDSSAYYLKGQYRSMLDSNSGLISAFSYTGRDAEGKAASYNKYKAELTYLYFSPGHSVALTGSYAYRDFNAVNPLFGKERSDDIYRLFLAYEYANIPGWKNWSAISFVGSTFTTSNIDFYESNDLIMSVGLNYKF
ncbi:DUF2860 domain-containing protein [Photobacterium sp. SDRW27]|uniref:DUF2860 family protein n=1 Tax=Photobacterium obscurum TaxID=2829490 RepID=UPI002243054E|nr:DUF2860 family protein [Photobacterium obscurum]MCW8329267.1 DUF2860 domain-containing protein [Photobacterium obscurum]